MGTLYLVRHGQASLGAADYDNLSALGQRQSERLGAYFLQQGLVFNSVWTGTLKRQQQTLDGIAKGMGTRWAPHTDTAWNEYDSAALLATLQTTLASPTSSSEAYRRYFQSLRDALRGWMDGVLSPEGMPSYSGFRNAILGALTAIQTQAHQRVLVVSSGGPIATAAGAVLRTTPETTIELNLQLRNTAVTQVHVGRQKLALISFNEIPHLANSAPGEWVTHA